MASRSSIAAASVLYGLGANFARIGKKEGKRRDTAEELFLKYLQDPKLKLKDPNFEVKPGTTFVQVKQAFEVDESATTLTEGNTAIGEQGAALAKTLFSDDKEIAALITANTTRAEIESIQKERKEDFLNQRQSNKLEQLTSAQTRKLKADMAKLGVTKLEELNTVLSDPNKRFLAIGALNDVGLTVQDVSDPNKFASFFTGEVPEATIGPIDTPQAGAPAPIAGGTSQGQPNIPALDAALSQTTGINDAVDKGIPQQFGKTPDQLQEYVDQNQRQIQAASQKTMAPGVTETPGMQQQIGQQLQQPQQQLAGTAAGLQQKQQGSRMRAFAEDSKISPVDQIKTLMLLRGKRKSLASTDPNRLKLKSDVIG